MTYIDAFKNTYMVDVLEFLRIVRIKETIQGKYDIETQNNSIYSNNEQTEKESKMYNDSDSDGIQSNTSSKTAGDSQISDSFLVSWNGDDDPDNPHNWSLFKQSIIISQVMLLSFITYMGSSIYTPGQLEIQEEFKVGHVTATLNLSIYVIGYGLGQIIFAPLSETAKIGRQQIYTYTLFAFAMIQIGCATVDNIGGLIVLRFFAGIFCGPALATGGATIADLIEGKRLTEFIALWAIGATAAPVIAPLLGASMVVAKNWRWIFWLLLFMSVACLVMNILIFPETSAAAILSRRATRIRNETGDNRYYTVQEKEDSSIELKEFLIMTFYRPFEIIVKEPVVLAFDIYLAVVYGALYLFFESFPIVFVGIYHFTLIESTVAFMGFAVGCALAYPMLIIFLNKVIYPSFANGTFVPEKYLLLAMYVSWCLPLSLFLFGWAAGTHWIVPIIAEIFFIIAVWNLFQVTFSYLAFSFPNHIASVFAGNGVMRSSFACAFPLFGKAMYDNLAIEGYPVGWGSTIVGFITIGLSAIPFVLYKYGAALRAKSKFID